nr:putative ribonuclease E [Arabidopsis thaliana]
MQTDSEQDVESCDDNENNLNTDEQNHQLTETLLPDGGFFQSESIATTILINSSICTVQRIAVLEGGKLVELLLEPVKTNVQCDSVYLGVITKFVPHMGGAFVNIGSARHSFMDIKSNREPFIFPPFCDGSKKQAADVRKGTKIIVQVVKEGLGTKGPTLTAYPKLRSRFWVLLTRCKRIGVSKKISGVERTRLKVIAKTLQPQGFGLTVRTVAAGHSLEELQKDLDGLLLTWKNITDEAKSAALAADEGPFQRCYIEQWVKHYQLCRTISMTRLYIQIISLTSISLQVTHYLQDMAPDLCNRVELHDKGIPLFDLYEIEEEIEGILSKRVPLSNGGSLVIEQTEALVSIDVNGGHGMFGQGNSQEKAILEVNLAAARQIAREIRLRDIGGIIVVDFIDMADESNKRLVYEEVKKAVERDRSLVKVSELSRHGLMEITRKRVRPSVTFMISEPCSCCHATGRVEALETTFSKIEQEICRQLVSVIISILFCYFSFQPNEEHLE